MSGPETSMRALLGTILELYDDWIVLDKQGANLLQELIGAISSVGDIDRGIESLYLAPPVIESYSTNRSASAVQGIIEELQDLISSYNDIIATSMRIQMSNLGLLSQLSFEASDEVTVSPVDMSEFIDELSAMFLQEFSTKNSIVADLKLESPISVLSTYNTTWCAKPHIDELKIEAMKERLKVHDQAIMERPK